MNQSNWMIPGARENWRSLLYKESKIIENLRVLFAGDDFENISFLNIDETPLILFMDLSKKNVHFVHIKKRQDYMLFLVGRWGAGAYTQLTGIDDVVHLRGGFRV